MKTREAKKGLTSSQITSVSVGGSAVIQYVEQILTWVLLSVLLLGFGYFLLYSAAAIWFPFPLDYGEGPLLNQAQLLAAGKNIYQPDLTDYPYTIANYPPVYVTTLALFSKLFGLSYAIGRTISVIAALVSATLIALILSTLTHDRVASATAGLLFLAFPYVIYWSSLVRVDLMALAFSLAGVFVISRWIQERWSPLISALFMVGAVFTRQSYLLAGPLAVAGWLFFQSHRKAGTFLFSLVAGTLIAFLSLNRLTQGGFFFHTIIANANSFLLNQLAFFLTHLVITSALLLAISAIELVSAAYQRQRASILLLLYLIGGFLSALTVGKVGANANYLLELVAALCLVTGAAVARWRQSSQAAWARLLLFILLALQVMWLLRVDSLHTHRTKLRFHAQPELETLEQIVEKEPGPVLADEYMGLLVMNQHELLFQPFEFTQLALEGKWSQNKLVDDIRAGRFGLILISDQPPISSEALARSRWTREMRAAIEKTYEPIQILAGTTAYRPKERR